MDGRIACIDYASASESELSEQALLDGAERDRLKAVHHPRQRLAFLAGRTLIRSLAARELDQSAKSITIAIGPGGKPCLRDFPHWQFNLSHSHGLCVLASDHWPIGIDLEYVRDASSYASLAAGLFDSSELQLMDDPDRGFFRAWSRREAWLKMRGTGLAGLGEIPDTGFCRSALIALNPSLGRGHYLVSLCPSRQLSPDASLDWEEAMAPRGAFLEQLP